MTSVVHQLLPASRLLLAGKPCGHHVPLHPRGLLGLRVSVFHSEKCLLRCFSHWKSNSWKYKPTHVRYQHRRYSQKSREEKEKEFKEHEKKREKNLHMNRMVDIVGLVYLSFGVIYIMAYLGRKMYLKWKGFKKIKVPGQKVKFYSYRGVTVPESFIKIADKIREFQVRPDDVWVVAFPRSGTTWVQEIVYLLMSDLNFDGSRSTLLDDRFPHLEWLYPSTKRIDAWQSSRLIKSNLPLTLLPQTLRQQKPKIIYLARNPNDVIVSNYYYSKMIYPITKFDGNFEDFFDMFLDHNVLYGPWSQHVKDFWGLRNEENILFITYEDLQKDTSGTVDKIAKFLGKEVSETDKQRLIDHCGFNQMKENFMVNHAWYKDLGVSTGEPFLRKGLVGDWLEHFGPGMQPQLDQWVKDTLSTPDLHFTYLDTESQPV